MKRELKEEQALEEREEEFIHVHQSRFQGMIILHIFVLNISDI